MADLCLLAYHGGFRVKSELIPATFRGVHSCWDITSSNRLRIWLRTRKNRREPTFISRTCDCARNTFMCPHTPAERRIRECILQNRSELFTLSYARALNHLREALIALQIPDANTYAFHAFRRGLSQDLLRAKTPLRDILAACDWSSQTFAWYLSREQIDEHAVLAAAADLSDDEHVCNTSASSSSRPTPSTVALGNVHRA